MPEQSYDHHNHRHQKHDNRDPVHAMHEFEIDIPWFIRVSLTYIEVRQDLLPHSRVFDVKLGKTESRTALNFATPEV